MKACYKGHIFTKDCMEFVSAYLKADQTSILVGVKLSNDALKSLSYFHGLVISVANKNEKYLLQQHILLIKKRI